ncbi:double-stranded RNA-binding protein 1-like [Trifolium pratense]|uniref:double-stranded RNA-binding protein 1-like n=1 Tax=Trifolium pratense TaxID=57577 RepID=UPI001E697631|nr:double-stranded RNA-binding protein 1-like [Trifolium pratense]XP_045816875.1 double-stranded RNA-binding protein 1-like [Trifolium pratense]XP_045816876.1 double-stranded RNA-binding protein 1-like [Trifolium pratense]XP_045816877.1 double-stranded RNA-binding protein 1-like [Trifolium pratense]XP_045816878.1 double-stranded RNA-binding protein 1-like [Trifolium pratense]XP_045816879.1 double-stranded RNA-binding protein 1-like [Trifolium pratense]XP_045816880.1 double-stranded RNA-bindin
MYKTQLQQLCQRQRWSLPEYSHMNEGLQHKPSYKASVVVNGVTFTSSDTFNSSKEAQNQAAMKAFYNFSSPPPSDTDRLSKNHLNNYARKNNLDPPVYKTIAEGLPHDIHYKATVFIDGKSFESPTFFNTIRDAEQAAAKIALKELPISVDVFQKDESCPSKSLLLELTQREGFCKPTYKTTESGSSHLFFSTVEVEGLEFHGKASRSKKLAENDAAKISYIALKECGLDMYASFCSSFEENQELQSTDKSDIVKPKQNLSFEDELLDKEILPTDVKINNGIHNESFPLRPKKKFKPRNMSSSSSSTDLPSVSVSELNKATSSYLIFNRLKITVLPDTVFPDGNNGSANW